MRKSVILTSVWSGAPDKVNIVREMKELLDLKIIPI